MHAEKHRALFQTVQSPRAIQQLAAELGMSVDALVSVAIGREPVIEKLAALAAGRAAERFEAEFPGVAAKLALVWPVAATKE